MLAKLISTVTGQPLTEVVGFFRDKQKLKNDFKLAKLRAKVAGERAKEERSKQADSNNHEWSVLQIRNSGWKDEFVLLVISTPFILNFIPGMSKYVQDGFKNLENTPVWYQVMLVTIFFAIYGIKKWSMRAPK